MDQSASGASGATIEHFNNDGPFENKYNIAICCQRCNSSKGNDEPVRLVQNALLSAEENKQQNSVKTSPGIYPIEKAALSVGFSAVIATKLRV